MINWINNTVLIAGGVGFIGSHIALRLVDEEKSTCFCEEQFFFMANKGYFAKTDHLLLEDGLKKTIAGYLFSMFYL